METDIPHRKSPDLNLIVYLKINTPPAHLLPAALYIAFLNPQRQLIHMDETRELVLTMYI